MVRLDHACRRGAGRRTNALAIVLIASALAVAAQAQLYRWVDEQGRVQYSDTLPPQATDRARAKLRPDGIVLEKVERAPTAEEKRAQALREEQLARERAAREARERLDRA
ncbi:MAG: DUF4124 domain-containing protein, partial [Casimicrobiaceae bacterium]|nr:DUF4124 domain-containing protein [Casimicrobiaceae bacterium]